jgi:hypothetical protein
LSTGDNRKIYNKTEKEAENTRIKPNQQSNPETPMQKKIEMFMLYNTRLLLAPSVEQKLNPEIKYIEVPMKGQEKFKNLVGCSDLINMSHGPIPCISYTCCYFRFLKF